MQTLIIAIIGNKAVRLLHDVELLQLIRVRRERQPASEVNWAVKSKGAMTK